MDAKNRIDDALLEEISGGMEFKMKNDPIYKAFSDFWDHRPGGKATGMEARAEFLDTFRKWLSAGMPKDIAKWYEAFKKN